MVNCYVPGCLMTKGLHSFPVNAEIRKKWIEVTRNFHLSEDEMNSFAKVCRNHFNECDFELNPRRQIGLKPNTIPSRLLPEVINFQSEHNYSSAEDDTLNIPIRQRRKRRAAVPIDKLLFSLTDPPSQNGILIDAIETVVGPSVNINHSDEIKQLKQKITQLTKQNELNQKKIKKLRQQMKSNKLDNSNVIKYLSAIFNEQQLCFFKMQINNSGRKSRGRRYTAEEKSLALALYKHSPKNYRFMQKIFILPDKKTLGHHSAGLIFEAGIDDKMFEHIKIKASSMPENEKYVTLSWDEVSLKAHLDYSTKRDVIDGFVESVTTSGAAFATHALTFMVRGIQIPFKQAIGYFYTDGLKSIELAEMIKLMTNAVLDTGLIVMVSTCDQVGVNGAAIDVLMDPNYKKSLKPGGVLKYTIRNMTIIHIFDPPHLIKGIRNNLMTKDLDHFVSERWTFSGRKNTHSGDENSALTASWDDVEALYNYNLGGSTKLLTKISKEHIAPEKKKMKVSVAAQVFSATYGNVMLQCSEKQLLKRDLSGTAQILLFFNDVFDSINGSSSCRTNQLKKPVTESSIHFSFWNYAVEMLSNMKFIDKATGKETNRTGVLKRFESTLRGFIEISRKCFQINIPEVSIRNMNQDGLENFFGCLKTCMYNPASTIPTHFRSAWTTLFVNNLTSANSIKSNCELDISTPLLRTTSEILFRKEIISNNSNQQDMNENYPNRNTAEDSFIDTIVFDPQFSEAEMSNISIEAVLNASSSVCDKLLKITKCKDCNDTIETTDLESITSVNHPSDVFKQNFKKIMCGVNEVIPHICTEKGVKKKLLECIAKVDIENMGCPLHDDELKLKFVDCCAYHGILTFCKSINDFLSGKNETLPPDFNFIEERAYIFRQKRKKHVGKYSDIFNL